jgi:adenylate cyclase
LSQDVDIERRLAAVLAADVAGFSRLTEHDEVGTMRMLASQRLILDAAIARHRGRIANTAGDSVLAEFPSAVNAVQCAVEAQQALRDAAEGAPEDRRVLFRIGIHVGDVMVRSGDLLGSGVNVAARLEALADTGGIVISAAAHEQVRKILPLAYVDLGPQQVKNIEEPMQAFAIGSAPRVASLADDGKLLPLPDKPSIAVLPFQNMSGDPEQEYFADGIVEDIITALSRFKSLFVIARNSSFTYKGKAVDIKQVGRELGVRYVLEGSVRKAGGRVRVTGQLIEATTGAHLWADRFEGMLEDVFEVQDKVTEQVVIAIAPRLSLAEIERTRLKRPESLDCYDHVLRALSLLRPPTSEGLRAAVGHLHEAVRLAPNYCLAHALLAESFASLDMIGDIRPGEAQAAMHHAGLATKLGGGDDPESLAYASFAAACFDSVRSAIVLTEKALKLNPNLARAWSLEGFAAMYLAQPDRAIASFERALRLNPMDARNPTVLGGMATVHYLRGDYDQALACAEQGLLEMPSNMQCLRALAMTAARTGDAERARSAAEKLRAYPRNIERIRKMMTRTQDVERIIEGLELAGYTE